ncbi:hypothetical protein Dimus_022625 [Dionaea muscipula]
MPRRAFDLLSLRSLELWRWRPEANFSICWLQIVHSVDGHSICLLKEQLHHFKAVSGLEVNELAPQKQMKMNLLEQRCNSKFTKIRVHVHDISERDLLYDPKRRQDRIGVADEEAGSYRSG